MSRMFRRTSVPGYVYGSELSSIQRLNLRGHLLGRQIAGNIAIEDCSGCLSRFKALQPHGRYCPCDTSLTLGSFLVRNRLDGPGHECCSFNILPWCKLWCLGLLRFAEWLPL